LASNHIVLNTRNVLTNFFVFIGKISYSTYLIHWPIIVFYKYYFSTEFNLVSQIFLILLCFSLAYILFKFVENPFRKKNYNNLKKSITVIFIILISATIFISSVIWAKGDFFWRYKILKYDFDEITRANDHFKDMNIIGKFRQFKTFNENAKYKILLLGDSHMEDVGSSIMLSIKDDKNFSILGIPLDDTCYANYDTRDSIFLRYIDKMGESCNTKRNLVLNSNQIKQASHIILVNHWENYSINLLKVAKNLINNVSSAKLIIVGQGPIFDSFDNFFYDNLNLGETEFNSFLFKSKKKDWAKINQDLKALAIELNIPYIDRYEHICDSASKICKILIDKKFTYKDRSHWSYFGKEFFSDYIFREIKNNL
jgi:hypothetical protein